MLEEKKPDIIIEEPAMIIDGYVIINLKKFGAELIVKQKVKRQKFVGATNDQEKPGEIALEIISWFLNMPRASAFTVKYVHYKINEERIKKHLDRRGFSSVQGRMSELVNHKVLSLTTNPMKFNLFLEKNPKYYVLDWERANQVLEQGKF